MSLKEPFQLQVRGFSRNKGSIVRAGETSRRQGLELHRVVAGAGVFSVHALRTGGREGGREVVLVNRI